MEKRELFLNKKCKLEKKNHFFLIGIVLDIDERGVVFQTTQATSYISWDDIKELIPMRIKNGL